MTSSIPVPQYETPNQLNLSQLPDKIQFPRLRHQASPQIVFKINAIISNANNSPSTSSIPMCPCFAGIVEDESCD